MSYQFQGQRRNEEVVLIVRQHPFMVLHRILWAVLVLLIPFFFFVVLSVGLVFSISIIAGLVIGLFMLYTAWFSWNRTMLLVTNERVVFLEQRNLFQRELVECSIATIQQVSHSVTGILHTMLGYGTIAIHTGGSVQPIQIPGMPAPYEIQQEILRAQSGEGFIESDPAPEAPNEDADEEALD